MAGSTCGRWRHGSGGTGGSNAYIFAQNSSITVNGGANVHASGYGGEWQRQPSLYEAEIEAYFDVLQQAPDAVGSVLIVAHNPGVEEMIEALTGHAETMPTGALAHITLPIDDWRGLEAGVEGQLVQVGRPREVE